MTETDDQGSFGGLLGDARLATAPGSHARDDGAPDDAGSGDYTGSEETLAHYLELAALADQQMPALGFFPPTFSAVRHSSGRKSAAGPNAAVAAVRDETAARIVADPVAWYNAERRGLLETTRWACDHGRYLAGARLASRQLTFQYLQHRLDDADQMWRAVERGAERAGDIAISSEARFHLAWVMADSGRFPDAYAALDKCIPILQARGVRGTLAVALYWRAFCADMLGRYEGQRDDAERCLGLARQLREPGIEVMALRMLGQALVKLDSHDRGLALCEQAVALAREQGELAWEYYAISSVAHASSLAERFECSEHWCHQGIEVSRRLGLFVSGRAYMLGMLGDARAGQGRYAEALEAYCQAMTVFKENGELRGQAVCLLKLGRAHIALGQPRQATEFLQQCFPMFGELGLPAHEDETIKALEECRTARDRVLTSG
jgi:tetratricopeptide (TPR) repeat protein